MTERRLLAGLARRLSERPSCPSAHRADAIVEPFHGRNDLRRNLVGLSREAEAALAEAGLEPFRARQVWQWVYWHGVTDFERMTNIARKTRERLAELFVIARPRS